MSAGTHNESRGRSLAVVTCSCMVAVFLAAAPSSAQPQPADLTARSVAEASRATAEKVLEDLSEQPARWTLLHRGIEDAHPMKLGPAVAVFWLPMEVLPALAQGRATFEAVARNEQVIYPVVNADGSSSMVLTVAKTSDQGWRQSVVGRPALAHAMTQILALDAQKQQLAPADYYAVEVPALRVIFLARGSGDGVMLIPLEDQRERDFSAGLPVPLAEGMRRLLPR